MGAVVERLVHVRIGRDGGAQIGIVTEIEVLGSDTNRGVVPLLQTMPATGRKELDRERSA